MIFLKILINIDVSKSSFHNVNIASTMTDKF